MKNHNKNAVDVGLACNNDARYPSLIVIGQIMDALLSGEYDLNRTAVLMSQTGGGCRASNYIGFIRRALEKAGMSQIPVISVNANKMETNPGFSITLPMLTKAMQAIVYGDVFMRILYATRPYEEERKRQRPSRKMEGPLYRFPVQEKSGYDGIWTQLTGHDPRL